MSPALAYSRPAPARFSDFDPAIAALLGKIPPAGSPWPMLERLRWFRAMAAVMTLVYGGEDDRQIVVTLESES